MSSQTSSLPVYVIHWNAPEWCEQTVASILRSDIPVDVCVVHNGGDEPRTTARMLRPGRNLGFTGAANFALGEWGRSTARVVICSHDLVVEESTLGTMAASPADIVGPSLSGPNIPQGQRDWLSGSCLMISAPCAAAVGPFDERFGSYMEDVDYCYRAQQLGFTIEKVSARAATHGSSSTRARRLIYRNQVLFEQKHSGTRAGLRRIWIHAKEATVRAGRRDMVDARDHLWAIVTAAPLLVRYAVVDRRSSA